jgi:Sulfotransferase family
VMIRQRVPDFVVIGAMKCGTSTLHEQLGRQPGIIMADPKEPCFFSNDDVWARGIDWYASLFACADHGDLCGESSTHYTKLPTYPNTIQRMRRHIPDAKLIYVIRHPIDRLVSHYVHDWSERKLSYPIDEAVESHSDLINYSRYAMQLEPFLDAYGPEQMLLVFFECLIARPQAELERICRFIGYEGRPCWQTDQDVRNKSSQRLRTSPLRDAIVWNPFVTWARRKFVPRSCRDRIKQCWQMKNRPTLGEHRRAVLAELFDRDLHKLGNWLGIDIACVSFKQVAATCTPAWSTGAPAPAEAAV